MSKPTILLHRAATVILYTLLILQTDNAIHNTEASESFSVMNQNSSEINSNVTGTKVEECMTEPEMMESETSRRVLLIQKRYISYETLRRDMVPCAKPGVSYYSCHAGQANPYSRGCEVITRCRGGGVRDIKS